MLTPMRKWWCWLKAAWSRRKPESPERRRALALIAAIDGGGGARLGNPARVNDIARGLGLDIASRKAPVESTIARIRQALDFKASGAMIKTRRLDAQPAQVLQASAGLCWLAFIAAPA